MCVALNLDIYTLPGLKSCTLVSPDGCWSVQLPCVSQLPSQRLLLPVRRLLAWCCRVCVLLAPAWSPRSSHLADLCLRARCCLSLYDEGTEHVWTTTWNAAFGWRLPIRGVKCAVLFCTLRTWAGWQGCCGLAWCVKCFSGPKCFNILEDFCACVAAGCLGSGVEVWNDVQQNIRNQEENRNMCIQI